MPWSGAPGAVDTSSKPAAPPPEELAQQLAAQAISGTGARSLCQAYTAARAAATTAKLPHVAAAIATAFGAGTGTAAGTARGSPPQSLIAGFSQEPGESNMELVLLGQTWAGGQRLGL